MFLVVTNERDLTSDYVVLELEKRGLEFTRLNTERLSEGAITFNPQNGVDGWIIEIEDRRLDLRMVRAAYFRRPAQPNSPVGVSNEESIQYCKTEWGALLSSVLNSLGNRWLNSPRNIAFAEDKPRQLALAIGNGFYIPKTLISNDATSIQGHFGAAPIVSKVLRESLLDAGHKERAIFTNRINSLHEIDHRSIEVAPAIFQSFVEKHSDIRVTVIGENVYAAEIFSQDHPETRVDWRRGSHPELVHQSHELPKDIQARCISLVKALDLRFGAIDLVLDEEGAYWFLEVNPNGQWAWIENRTGLPLTHAIVDELERIAKCSPS